MTGDGARVRALRWDPQAGELWLLDQRLLPREERWLRCTTARQVHDGIRDMVVRGAPAIGVAAAYGVVLAALGAPAGADRQAVLQAAAELRTARPTAVNLAWAVDRMLRVVERGAPDLAGALAAEASAIEAEDERTCRLIGEHGAPLLPEREGVLTLCNTGALATAGEGTALAVIRHAWRRGRLTRVYASETRPYLQGARLTAWELRREHIPVTLIVEGAAGTVLRRGLARAVVVGADRVTANGDVVNKVGTYPLAVLAKEHGVPFYVAFPLSTADLSLPSGQEVPIEERDPAEVTHVAGTRVAPEGVDAFNPAFDVTPTRYVSGFITEAGVLRPPLGEALRAVKEAGGARSGAGAAGGSGRG